MLGSDGYRGGGVGMLGQRRWTPRWEDDSVVEAAKTMAGEEEHQTAGGESGAGPISKLCNNK